MDSSTGDGHVLNTAGVLASLRIVCDKLEDASKMAEAGWGKPNAFALQQHTADLHAEAEAIDTHLARMSSIAESSLLRPVAVKAYNAANNKAPNASIETARCLYRTGVSWLSIPGQEVEAYRAFCAVLACHDSSGGVQAAARILGGQDLEAHLQMLYDCYVQKAAFEWDSITVGTYSPAVLLMASHSQGYGSTAALAVGGEGVAATPAAVAELHDRVLKELASEAAGLLTHLPHQSPALASLCADRGKWYADQCEYSRAKAWLEKALTLAQSAKQGVQGSTAHSVATMSMLLLAACEVGLAEGQKKANGASHCLSGSSMCGGQAGVLGAFDMHSLAQKVQGYIAGAGAASTLLGVHLQLKLSCLQEDVDGASAHFSQLLGHLASAKVASGGSASGDMTARRTVPLGNKGEAAALQVHPDYPIIASACHTYADLRRYDDQALRAYAEAGQHFKGTGTHGHLENTLLMHDLLAGLVVAIGSSSPSTASGGVCSSYALLADKRVSFVLGAMLKRHAQGQAPMPAHVHTAVSTILEGGLRSAFEEKAWSSAEKLGNHLLQLYAGDNHGKEGVRDSQTLGAQADVHRVLSLAYIHKGELSTGLQHAVQAGLLQDSPSIRFHIFRILAHMPCVAAMDGANTMPTAQKMAESLQEQLHGGHEIQAVDVSFLDSNSSEGYLRALCSAFLAFVKGCSTLPAGSNGSQAMAGVLLLAVDVIVRGCSPDGLKELCSLEDWHSDASGAGGGTGKQAHAAWHIAEADTAHLRAHAPKLVVACTALELLLRLCESSAWDSTSVVPSLRLATLVEQLLSLRRVLRRAQDGAGKDGEAAAAVHARTDLRLLSVCLSRLNACRKEEQDPVAFVHAVARTCAAPEQMAWCMRSAYSCAMTSHQYGDTLGSLAALMLVSSLATVLHQMQATWEHLQAGSTGLLTWGLEQPVSLLADLSRATSSPVPQFLIPELRTRNLLVILRSTVLLQAMAHLQLSTAAREGTLVQDAVGAAVGKDAVGVDLCVPLLAHSEMTFLQSAMQSIIACRRSSSDLAQQEVRLKTAATQAGAAPAVLASLLQTVQQDATPQVLTDADIQSTLCDLCTAADSSCALTLRGYRAERGTTEESEQGDCPSPAALQALARDDKALASVLAVLEFHATAKQQALQGPNTAAGAGQAGGTGLSKVAVEQLSAQIGRLQLLPGMNAHLLETIACIVQSEPCQQPALALRALHAAMGLALKPLSATDTLAGQAAVDYPYVAFLLQRMMQVLDSRKDSLPVLDTAMIAVQACVRAALAQAQAGGGPDVDMQADAHAVRLFPVEALDAMACKAWNHGIFYSRVHAVGMAESFLSWSMRAVPLLLQLEALAGNDVRRAQALARAFHHVSAGSERADDVLSELKRRESGYWLPQARLAVQLLHQGPPLAVSTGMQAGMDIYRDLCGQSKVLTDSTVCLEAHRLLPCCEDVLRQQGVHPDGMAERGGGVPTPAAVISAPVLTAVTAVATPVPVPLVIPEQPSSNEVVVPLDTAPGAHIRQVQGAPLAGDRVPGKKAARSASTDDLLLMPDARTSAVETGSASDPPAQCKRSPSTPVDCQPAVESDGRGESMAMTRILEGVATGAEDATGSGNLSAVQEGASPVDEVMEGQCQPQDGMHDAQGTVQPGGGQESEGSHTATSKVAVPLMQPEEEWGPVEMGDDGNDTNDLL